MAASQQIKELVGQMPAPDKNGTYADMTAEKAEQIEKVVAGIRTGGRDALLALVDMLVEPGKGDDIKAHFALHVLAVRLSGEFGGAARREFAETLASQLSADRPTGVKAYLIEQLRVAGGKEVAAQLGKALLDEQLCDLAARALEVIGDGAGDVLLAAVPKVSGRGRLSVIKKLAVLREKKAAKAFRDALTDEDADVRIAAGLGISRIADASAVDAMLAAAAKNTGWERINLTDACMALAEALLAAGDKKPAAAIYSHMVKTRTDPSDSHIRQAAARGLDACG